MFDRTPASLDQREEGFALIHTSNTAVYWVHSKKNGGLLPGTYSTAAAITTACG